MAFSVSPRLLHDGLELGMCALLRFGQDHLAAGEGRRVVLRRRLSLRSVRRADRDIFRSRWPIEPTDMVFGMQRVRRQLADHVRRLVMIRMERLAYKHVGLPPPRNWKL